MRGRVLILIGAVILLAVVLVVFLMTSSGGGDETDATATPGAGTTEPESPRVADMVEIVVAIQDMPRGMVIPANGVAPQLWPEKSLSEGYFLGTEINQVIGQIARTDIFRGTPVLSKHVTENLYEIARTGSDAAAMMNALPNDRSWVAVSIPLDPSGIGQVAYGIQDGDFVDVALSFLFVDVDPTFQTRMPNNVSLITRLETGELSIGAPRQGRQEASTLSPEGVLVGPSEDSQRPRLVTQRTVTNAWVLHVGYFPPGGNIIGATPTSAIEPTQPPPGEGNQQQATTPLPSATAFTPLIITLAVIPQDALVLAWAVDAQIPITLFLRTAGDDRVTNTQPVTLDYMISTYNAEPPNALEFALEPPITSIRRFDIGTLVDFLGKTVTGGE